MRVIDARWCWTARSVVLWTNLTPSVLRAQTPIDAAPPETAGLGGEFWDIVRRRQPAGGKNLTAISRIPKQQGLPVKPDWMRKPEMSVSANKTRRKRGSMRHIVTAKTAFPPKVELDIPPLNRRHG